MSTLNSTFVHKDVKAYQEAIQKAYYQIITEIIELLQTLLTPHLRTHCELQEDGSAHKFISPCINISLSEDLKFISFALHKECREYIGFSAYDELCVIIYRNIKRENTNVFIEYCLNEFDYDFMDYEKVLNNPEAQGTIEPKSQSQTSYDADNMLLNANSRISEIKLARKLHHYLSPMNAPYRNLTPHPLPFDAYRQAVRKAYYKIIEEVVELLKTLHTTDLRTHIVVPFEETAHKFISVPINLTLAEHHDRIMFARNYQYQDYIGPQAFSELSRIVYRNTMSQNTEVFIEDCLDEAGYIQDEFEIAIEMSEAIIIVEDPI
jgi:hypothetical protein